MVFFYKWLIDDNIISSLFFIALSFTIRWSERIIIIDRLLLIREMLKSIAFTAVSESRDMFLDLSCWVSPASEMPDFYKVWLSLT